MCMAEYLHASLLQVLTYVSQRPNQVLTQKSEAMTQSTQDMTISTKSVRPQRKIKSWHEGKMAWNDQVIQDDLEYVTFVAL